MRTIIVPDRSAPHHYDDLIESLAAFLDALIKQRDRDHSTGSLVGGGKPSKRQFSDETRARMAAAQRRRFALARDKKKWGDN